MQLRALPPKSYLWMCLALTFFLAAWAQWPWLTDPYAVEEDFRNMYWVHRYEDPSLYPNVDFGRLGVTEYTIGPWRFIIEDTSPGYSLLLQLGSHLLSPILFHKLLVFPLALIAAFYLFRIGEQLSNSKTALVLSLVFIVLNLATHTEVSVVGGLHRSFVMPLILAFAYYLMTNRHWIAALVIFIAGIVYAPIFPVLCMTYALSAVQFREGGRWRIKIAWPSLLPLSIAMLLVVLSISTTPLPVHQQASNDSESLHILDDPAYQPGGRRPLFILFPIIGRGGIVSSGEMFIPIVILSILATATYLLRNKQTIPLPKIFKNLIIASFIGFSLAWLALILTSSFLLYVPSRHTQSTLFLAPLIYVIINTKQTLHSSSIWLMQNKKRLTSTVIPFLFLGVGFSLFYPYIIPERVFTGPSGLQPILLTLTLLLVILTVVAQKRQQQSIEYEIKTSAILGKRGQIILSVSLLFIVLFYIRTYQAEFHTPSAQGKELNAFVETLPKDALIFGHPCLLDDIPFYAKRSVLFSCERFKFLENEQRVVMDSLTAYYAEDSAEIVSFCQQYHVDFLIVSASSFAPEMIGARAFFFEPYNELLTPIVRSRSSFALSQVTDDNKLFQLGAIFIIPCQPGVFD